MALYKEVRQKSDVIATYHRISKIILIPKNNAEVTVASYLSEDARQLNKAPLVVKNYTWGYDRWGYGYENNYGISAFYELLKELPEYYSAIDT